MLHNVSQLPFHRTGSVSSPTVRRNVTLQNLQSWGPVPQWAGTPLRAELAVGVKAFELRPASFVRDVLEQEVSKVPGKACEEFGFLNSLSGSDVILFLPLPVGPQWITLAHKKGAQSSVRFVFWNHLHTHPHKTTSHPDSSLAPFLHPVTDVSTHHLAGCVPCPPLLLFSLHLTKSTLLEERLSISLLWSRELLTRDVKKLLSCAYKEAKEQRRCADNKGVPLESCAGISISICDILLPPEDFWLQLRLWYSPWPGQVKMKST